MSDPAARLGATRAGSMSQAAPHWDPALASSIAASPHVHPAVASAAALIAGMSAPTPPIETRLPPPPPPPEPKKLVAVMRLLVFMGLAYTPRSLSISLRGETPHLSVFHSICLTLFFFLLCLNSFLCHATGVGGNTEVLRALGILIFSVFCFGFYLSLSPYSSGCDSFVELLGIWATSALMCMVVPTLLQVAGLLSHSVLRSRFLTLEGLLFICVLASSGARILLRQEECIKHEIVLQGLTLVPICVILFCSVLKLLDSRVQLRAEMVITKQVRQALDRAQAQLVQERSEMTRILHGVCDHRLQHGIDTGTISRLLENDEILRFLATPVKAQQGDEGDALEAPEAAPAQAQCALDAAPAPEELMPEQAQGNWRRRHRK